MVPGWPVAFRGSAAVAAGLTTWTALRGPRFSRLFPDTYIAVPGDGRPDLRLRSHAAYRYIEGKGVLSGYSAAEALGASCGPWNAPAEVMVPHRGQRSPTGLVVHRGHLFPGEITQVNDMTVTSPVRTAYDLARRGDLVERVVAVDRLANVHRFSRTCYCTSAPATAVPAATTSCRMCSPMPTAGPARRWRPGSGC